MSNDLAHRRFLTSDAMILIAATAIGFAESRDLTDDLLELSLMATICLLVSWSIACLLIRLRYPRPPLGRLVNQPGASACLSGGVPSAFLHILAFWDRPRFMGYLAGSAFLSGFAVAAVWLVQMIGRELEPEAGWVDRLGVALGLGWVAIFLYFCLPYLLTW